MSNVIDTMLAAIGSTKILALAVPGGGTVWVKLEGGNPTGSYKDRMALAMIRAAEAAGRLRPGQAVVEYTGGSTGSSLAFVCALTGHPLHIVSSDAFAAEKIRTMEAFGAAVEILPSSEGITPNLVSDMRERAAELAAELGAHQTDQFTNTDMVEGYRALGEEAVAQVEGPIDAICSYVGTGGCILGTAQAVRAVYPESLRVIIEPAESPVISGRPAGTHRIEGGGVGFVPELLTPDSYDRIETVASYEAMAEARRAAREDGIFGGPSVGANLLVSRRLATELGPGSNVLTMQVDSGLKYLGGDTYSE
jgi:cysteine synthase A